MAKKNEVKNNSNLVNVANKTFWSLFTFTMLVGGIAIFSNKKDKDNAQKSDKIEQVVTHNAHAAPKWMDVKINPKSADFEKNCESLEDIILAGLVYVETYEAIPVVHAKENVWTHGYGMTWSPDSVGNMKIRDYAVSSVKEKVKNKKGKYVTKVKRVTPHKPIAGRSKQENIEETKQFLRDYIYPKIKANLNREIDAKTFVAICVAGYQMSGHVQPICENLNTARTTQQIADAFITETMWNYGGTPKRRWVSAAIATGYITMNDIQNAYVDGFYAMPQKDFFTLKKATSEKQHFILNADFVKKVLASHEVGKLKTVKQELGESQYGRIALNEIKTGNLLGQSQPLQTNLIAHYKGNNLTPDQCLLKPAKKASKTPTAAPQKNVAKTQNNKTLIAQYNSAKKSGNYSLAVQKLTQIIDHDPNNASWRNDLAWMYNRLKKYDMALAQVRYVIFQIKDKNHFGNAYYNAGVAYEKQGNSDKALANYNLAKKYGNGSAQSKINAISGMSKKSKKVAFNNAITKTKQNAFLKGLTNFNSNKGMA